jgi:putative tryptophan/tyrosine transport system substrate-binding protein
LSQGGAQQVAATPYAEALAQGLHELGYVEGHNLAWEYAFGENQPERLPELARGLVHRQVDVIVPMGHQAALAARDGTSTIPIVLPIHGDPVGAGLAASLAWPGGNVTGLSSMSPGMSAKRLELLREVLPAMGHVAVLWNGADLTKGSDYRETEAAAQALRLTIQSLPVRTPDEFEGALEAAGRERSDALVVLGDALTMGNHRRILDLAAASGLPVMYEAGELVP